MRKLAAENPAANGLREIPACWWRTRDRIIDEELGKEKAEE